MARGTLTHTGSGPPLTAEAALTFQFYDWERRGRGWLLWDHPVCLEPPFTPFAHVLPAPTPYDDGRTTFLQELFGWLGLWPRPALPSGPMEFALNDPDPAYGGTYVPLQTALAADVKIGAETAEQFLLSLTACSRPVSFEVTGTAEAIRIQMAAHEDDVAAVRAQLRAHAPDVVLTERADDLKVGWEASGEETVVVDFGLSNEFMRPIKACSRLEPADPLIGIAGALADLECRDFGILQVLFTPARAPWTESVLRSVTDWSGGSFFADDPQMLSLARRKVTRPLYAAVLRVAARSEEEGRAWDIARRLTGTLQQFSDPSSNEFLPLTNDGYDDEDHVHDLLARQSRRCGMLLNSEELVSLVHLPSPSVRSERLKRQEQRTKAAPASSVGHSFVLGENTANGRAVTVGLSAQERVRHMHVIGASGTGKSTFLLNLICQDLEQDSGFAVLDPHGDLIDHVLARIPEHRAGDVLLVDPSDAEYPVGFNILAAHSDLERTLLSSDLVAVFRRLATSWGDQMTSVLGNAILAFLESDRGGTLAELRRFLVEPEYRKAFLQTVRDPEVVYYWQREFPLLQGRPQAPLLTRLDTFLRPRLVRNIVSQNSDKVDVARIMADGKVLLVKLAQGAIGEENAALLGTLFVAKLHQAALGRQELKPEHRRPFYVYLDEFHHFITPSMASILSGARKYGLGLILAHQELRQLLRDPDVSSAVLSNAGTRVCFRVGDADAEKLAEGFGTFTASDLMNLGIGEAVCRIDRSQQDFNLRSCLAAEVQAAVAHERTVRVVERSRREHGMARADVEAAEQGVPFSKEVQAPPERVRPNPRGSPPRPAPSAKKSQLSPLGASAVLMSGRGSPQHKYLQQLIHRWGQDNGYMATVEKQVLDGLGSVDVALERDGRTVACEICVTTSIDHEVANVQKCLAAGFERVMLVVSDQRAARKARQALDTALDAHDGERVQALPPEELFAALQPVGAATAGAEQRIKGYRVKVTYGAADGGEASRKRSMAQAVLGAMRKLGRR